MFNILLTCCYKTKILFIFFQTIFEINSSSKTQASVVMRTKRSKDMRLVDKFNKHKEDVAAESRLHQPVKPAAADEDYTHAGEEEEGALNVRDEGLLCSVQNKASKMC